jgi:hypothetical protein
MANLEAGEPEPTTHKWVDWKTVQLAEAMKIEPSKAINLARKQQESRIAEMHAGKGRAVRSSTSARTLQQPLSRDELRAIQLIPDQFESAPAVKRKRLRKLNRKADSEEEEEEEEEGEGDGEEELPEEEMFSVEDEESAEEKEEKKEKKKRKKRQKKEEKESEGEESGADEKKKKKKKKKSKKTKKQMRYEEGLAVAMMEERNNQVYVLSAEAEDAITNSSVRHSLTPSLLHSFTPSLLHSFTPSLLHSFTPSLLL